MPRDNIPAIPPVPPGLADTQAARYLQSLRDALVVRLGQTRNDLDRSPTIRELIDGGIVVSRSYSTNGQPLGGVQRPPDDSPFSNISVPEAPLNLAVASTPFTNRLTWDYPPGFTANITAFTEVYANSTDDRASAVLIGIGNNSYVHAVEPMSTTYYWVRFMSHAGIPGAYNAVSGVVATSPQDPAAFIDLIEGAIGESELTDILNRRVMARAAGYIESFEDNDIDRILGTWTEFGVEGTSHSIVSIGAPGAGEYAWRMGDNSGTDDDCFRAVSRKLSTPIVAGGLYRIKAVYERVAGTQDIAIGLMGYKGDVYSGNGVYVSAGGANNFNAPHAFAVNDTSGTLGTFTVEGYFTRGAAFALNGGGLDDPHELHPDVEYVSPYIRTTGGTGTVELAYISVEQVPGGSEVSQSLNKYVVKVDANGYVAGYGLLVEDNDGVPTSEFHVAVDKFLIRSPGSTDLAFAVDGGSVVMNGAFIQNATISNAQISDLSADKINAGTLDATYIVIDGITLSNSGGTLRIETAGVDTPQIADLAVTNAKIENATITGAKIGTAEIDTLLIAGDAVTVPASATGGTNTGDGSWQAATSVTITLSVTADVLINWSFEQGYPAGSAPDWGYRVKRGTTTLKSREGMAAVNDAPSGAFLNTSVAAGTHTFYLEWKGEPNGQTITSTGSITVVGVQR